MGYIPKAKETEQSLHSVKGTEVTGPVPTKEESLDIVPQKDDAKNYGE